MPAVWTPLPRDYAIEEKHAKVTMEKTRLHPLLSSGKRKQVEVETKRATSSASEEAVEAPISPPPQADDPLRMLSAAPAVADDPLRAMMGGGSNPLDPLSAMSASPAPAPVSRPEVKKSKTNSHAPILKKGNGAFEMFPAKKARILQKYTTSERVGVSANFLDEDNTGQDQTGGGAAAKPVDQTQSRLDELETGNEPAQKNYLTQMEYITHMEKQHTELRKAWDAGDRVVSLKIAIQCAKLLGEVTIPRFYPSMFVLLTAILDTFGDLVFERIKRLGGDGNVPLPADFSSTHVNANAVETCKNWFYKIACIRELMPRLYIDLALIKSYRFLSDSQWASILRRLSHTIRGIGNPLVATYARAFLTSKARDLANSFSESPTEGGVAILPPGYQKALLEAYDDVMFNFKVLKENNFAKIKVIANETVTVDQYIDLYAPALEWITQNIGYGGSQDLFFALIDQYKEFFPNSGILIHLLSSFPAEYISTHALSMTNLIREAEDNICVPKSRLYLALGRSLMNHSPPQDQLLPILNDVWKVVTRIQDPAEYLDIAAVFVQFLLINFTEREVNIFLADVVKHVKQCPLDKIQSEPFQDKLQIIVSKTSQHSQDLLRTLSMDNFLSILDLLDKVTKVHTSKAILTKFEEFKGTTSDPVIIHTLFDVAKNLHDSLDSMSFRDEVRTCSNLIISFIRKIDFGRDLEGQLNVYVDCRQAFSHLDTVAEELILRVTLLCNKAFKLMKGKHTRKTAAFAKACLAYCHIAIPSLEEVFTRLQLFLTCGEVALVNGMIVQSEGFLKAAITLIREVPVTLEVENGVIISTEPLMESYVRSFTSFLLLFPGHPTHGPFYLLQGLVNAVGRYEPWKKACPTKTRVFMGFLSLLAAYGQRNFVLTIPRLESNDALYGRAPKYLEALNGLLDGVVTAIFEQIRDIGGESSTQDLMTKKTQANLALDFLNLLISSFTINKQTATLIVRLYGLTTKSDLVTVYRSQTKANIQGRKGAWYKDISAEISKLDA